MENAQTSTGAGRSQLLHKLRPNANQWTVNEITVFLQNWIWNGRRIKASGNNVPVDREFEKVRCWQSSTAGRGLTAVVPIIMLREIFLWNCWIRNSSDCLCQTNAILGLVFVLNCHFEGHTEVTLVKLERGNLMGHVSMWWNLEWVLFNNDMCIPVNFEEAMDEFLDSVDLVSSVFCSLRPCSLMMWIFLTLISHPSLRMFHSRALTVIVE